MIPDMPPLAPMQGMVEPELRSACARPPTIVDVNRRVVKRLFPRWSSTLSPQMSRKYILPIRCQKSACMKKDVTMVAPAVRHMCAGMSPNVLAASSMSVKASRLARVIAAAKNHVTQGVRAGATESPSTGKPRRPGIHFHVSSG